MGGSLSAAAVVDTGYFEPRAVEKLAAKCRKGTFIGFRDNMAFVGILSTQLWHRAFVAGAAAPVAAPGRAIQAVA